MSSTSTWGFACFSGLGVGWADCERGALAKKDVIDLYIGLGFAGDLAGDLLVAIFEDGLGDAARRVCTRAGLLPTPRAPFDMLVSVPLLGRPEGGECETTSSSVSDESTIGFLRAARGLTIPPRVDRSWNHGAAV